MNALNTAAVLPPPTVPAPPPGARAQYPLRAVGFMLAAGFCFVSFTAIVKWMGPGLPAAQSGFVRYLLGLVFVLPAIGALRRAGLTRRDLGLFGLRGFAHSLAVILWFYAMTRLPLAEMSAMGYLNPIFIAIGAALFLGERLRARRIAAIAMAIIGALIILRPGLRALEMGHLAMMGTAMLFAVSYLTAKQLADRVSPTVIVAMLSITVAIGIAPWALAVWQPMSWEQVGLLFIVACLATAGHYLMTLAFANASITVTQPVTALQLVWSVTLGAVFFAEPVDFYVVLGGVVIVSAVIFIAYREQVARAEERRRA